ncbi:MAG: hypothetical protein GX552_13430 [Chloroflexi bacterium]|jgi:hypothetical protein|nr:hypothetical protein [Chloroflexota bacterium]
MSLGWRVVGKRWAYRARQFFTRCLAREADIDVDAIRGVLPEPAFQLYQGMPLGDRIHAQNVWRMVQNGGPCSRDLEQAALLHDVGKSRANLSLVHRVLIVLIQGAHAPLLERLARDDPHSWRYPFYVHLHHAEIGALLCADAGCSPLTVALVRYHETRSALPDSPAGLRSNLVKLIYGDDRC